ncbi:hypothetical protein CsSME_00011386 [Camellia sinensis var. sinensis]
MFDWDEEELSNIIWGEAGEAGEADDHIVPYTEGSDKRPRGLYDHIKKEWNHEGTNSKPAEQTKCVAKNNYTGGKQEGSSQNDTTGGVPVAGYSMDRWPNLSLSHAAETDQDSMGTDSLTEITKYNSSRGDETYQVDNGSQIFQKQHEEREQTDFVDYGWANIGSFDDLDRIFSNDDPIFGQVSLGNSNQPWLSSKNVTGTPEKSSPSSMDSLRLGLGASRSTSGHFEVKTEYLQDQDQFFIHGYGKMSYLTSHAQRNVHASVNQVDNAGGKSISVAKEKVNNQKNNLKTQRKERCEGQQLEGSCSIWSPRENQFQQLGLIAPSMPQICTSSVLSQQTQIQGRVYSQYQHSPNSFVAPFVCGSNKIQNYTRTSLPQIYSREDNQPVLSGYNISPSNVNPSSRSPGTSLKSLTMTPQEKIEKLRRRQQMQALLAIQKQQQHLNHQVSNNDHSVEKKCLHENQIQLIQEGNIKVEEIVCSLPSIDPNSPIEQDDSNTVSMIVDENYYVEETILHRLEDIIAKLDIRIRLCIRDSLFRLAQSAKHRHYASDTSSTNKNSRDELEVLAKETSSDHSSFTRMPDMETETNPIDRTVAHLLFHRPAELSGKHPETPESPVVSTKLPSERNTRGLLSLPRGFFPDNYKSKHNLSYTAGSKNPHLFAEGDHSKNSSCIDTSENASNNEAADAGCMEIELSQ